MSNIYSRLRCVFPSTQKVANNIELKRILTRDRTSFLDQEIKHLLDERDSNKLVEKFKFLSQYSYFRRKYKIYESIIHRLTLAKKFNMVEGALEFQKHYICSEKFGARLIYLYGKAGMLNHAYKVFVELPQRGYDQGPISFRALLGAASNSEKFDLVYELFREVPSKFSIEPNTDCYNTAIHALCKLGLLDQAVALLNEMEEEKLKPCVVSYNTILGAFYEKGRLEEAEIIWERMVKSGVNPDIKSYNFKLNGLVNDWNVSAAMDLVVQLESSKGLRPDAGTFNALILGHCKNGELDEVRRWYNELLKYGCVPNKVTFNTIVPFLCDKGDYRLAFQVCQRMFKRQCSVDASILQKVVDGLVKKSMMDEANILVGLGRSNSFHPYNLVLPSRSLFSSFI